jgi:hypothetical protein
MIINKKLIFIGIVTLLTTSLVYLVDRPINNTYILKEMNISFHKIFPSIFGELSNIIPGFGHVFSFSLITAAFIENDKKKYFKVCISWFFIDVFFEIIQLLSYNTSNSDSIIDLYIGNGIFDLFDLLSITIGSIFAYFVILFLNSEKQHSEI